MATHYESICEENRLRYGTEGALKSGELAARLYDDRTHFIFELLQNAEDALARRPADTYLRTVSFELRADCLILSHYGEPFNEADVRSVCDIAESTKNNSAIGRFGLGFKSVYTVTHRPEIHSGEESFAIEDYVFPVRADAVSLKKNETKIILPLAPDDKSVAQDIISGFHRLGPNSLLFLKHIEEISWTVINGTSGFYLRNKPEVLGPNVQRVTVLGQESGEEEVDQNWLVFQRDVFSLEEQTTGKVEIAFSQIQEARSPCNWIMQPLPRSPLIVFFPTVVESHLGFLVQGPYRTTPSRENITPEDPWNKLLLNKTALMLSDAMLWMRDNQMLDVATLRCLPLDGEKHAKGTLFAPLFDAVRQAFYQHALLPAHDNLYITAGEAKLARSNELRSLFNPQQLAELTESKVAVWLSGEITLDKTPELLRYLTDELDVEQIVPSKIIPALNKKFLEEQSDAWVMKLYEFLSTQEAIVRRYLETIPLIRLENRVHVTAREKGANKVFLPSKNITNFPTVSRAVCATPEAFSFLRSLKISEPDPVDDVILHVLPKYQKDRGTVDSSIYAADIKRILSAFRTDSSTQKDKLRYALRDTHFVSVVDTANNMTYRVKPSDAYIATDRLKNLFAEVPGVYIVDEQLDCLRGEEIRELLVSCGASRYLMPISVASNLSEAQKEQLRRESGLERITEEVSFTDTMLRGLETLLEQLPSLTPEVAKIRAEELWKALIDLESYRQAVFTGNYSWRFARQDKTAQFNAQFVRMLNQVAWIPNDEGKLMPPGLVLFDSLGWKPSPSLQSRISFKPPIIDQLAKAAGIDPAVLDLLRSNPELIEELLKRQQTSATTKESKSLGKNDRPLDNDGPPETISAEDDDFTQSASDNSRQRVFTNSRLEHRNPHIYAGSTGRNSTGNAGEHNERNSNTAERKTPSHPDGRQFISYLATSHEDRAESDLQVVDQELRMQIERHALDQIIQYEPMLRRTPVGNPGFDLYEMDDSGVIVRWVEVKSMTGSLDAHPVGISRTQFEFAREMGDAYWLYVVEYASEPANTRILRIQDPVNRTLTFTFDRGWREIALTEPPSGAE
ncbi:TPA: DUF3883 domain-containing protein [Yersinia enterocolitica]|nr:DUF3883 domain-containing protein [Yersinia enterocolitica]HEM8996955.1 DUF3883 domain-containing protein [Yersinia enterocolitica]HEO8480706.1 DUF3883 domain-containing protein [Yersinia enterocolitica]